MPGEEAGYGNEFYPASEDEHRQVLTWCLQAFQAADDHRSSYYDRWVRYYKLYRSYVKREKGDWRSKAFIPHAFSVIETITPRLLAQLPQFVTSPMGMEDVRNAKAMETLLNYSASQANLYPELIKAVKSSLKYGTGIMKNYHRRDVRTAMRMEPIVSPQRATVQRPVTDANGAQVLDMNEEPMFEDVEMEMGSEITGYQQMPYEYVAYDGPASEAIDIFNFWVAPESVDIETARYVIQRVYREMSHVMEQVSKGVYRMPPEMGPEDITSTDDEPLARRLAAIELGGDAADPTRKPVELLEFWTADGRVITMANRKAILRVARNPFNHGEKPYVRIVDYLQEHEFWGVGEIEVLEGLQDLQNAIVNQRIDNVRLKMNGLFAVDRDANVDLRTLRSRPGGVIETSGPPSSMIQVLDLGDVTSSAFAEAAETERFMEKVSGVTAYQTGIDSPSLNDTATGVALISEQGNTKFALKLRLLELLALKPLARQWGAIIQQFTSGQRVVRMLGPEGQFTFMSFDPESLMGALDYDVATASSSQTESVRRQQDQMLLQILAGVWPYAVPQLVMDLLESFGKKNLADYMMGPQQLDFMGQIQTDRSLSEPVAPGEGSMLSLPDSLQNQTVQTRLQPRYPQ